MNTHNNQRLDGPTARLAMVGAVVASLLFVTFLVVSTSRAAFSDTTDAVSNSVAAGSVALSDDDLGTALFAVTGMAPLESAVSCIEVTYDGSIAAGSPVQLYAPAAATGTGLAGYLDMTVEVGSGATFGDCSTFAPTATIFSGGTLADFGTTHTGWASGLSTGWTPTGPTQTTAYRVTLTLQDDNAAQGLDANFGLTWEAQS